MKKIAFVLPPFLPLPPVRGGAMETLVNYLLLHNEKNHDFDFTVFGVEDGEAKKAEKAYQHTRFQTVSAKKRFAALDSYYVRGMRKLFKIEISPERQYLKRLLKQLVPEAFDTIIVENQIAFVRPIEKAVGKKNVVLHLHNKFLFGGIRCGEKILAACEGVLAVSDFIRRDVLTLPCDAPQKVMVLPNCVDTERFDSGKYQSQREEIRSRFGIEPDETVILYSGRLLREKGIVELVEAFSALKEPKVKLMIVGSSWYGTDAGTPFVEELRRLTEPVANRILFTGFVPYENMPAYYAAADICTLPSYMEASPLSVLEALACGRPIVVSDAGGIPENVTEACAVTVSRGPDMVPGLTRAFALLAGDEALRRRMGEAGRKFVQNRAPGSYYRRFKELMD